jgi:hypothetical protein
VSSAGRPAPATPGERQGKGSRDRGRRHFDPGRDRAPALHPPGPAQPTPPFAPTGATGVMIPKPGEGERPLGIGSGKAEFFPRSGLEERLAG